MHSHSVSSAVGYWGKVDASIDWCEQNYAVTQYIAEFWNTTSSIPMVIMGLIGAIMTWKYAAREYRYLVAFSCLSIVGLGSMSFHATLRQYAQFADELPMVWGNFAFFFSLLDAERMKPKGQRHAVTPLAVCVTVAAIGSTIIYVATPWYFIFLLSYGGVVAFCAVYCVKISSRMDKLTKHLMIICLSSYAFGLLLWGLEHIFCESIEPYQFHAWWHIFSGVGSYIWIMVSVAWRAKMFRKRAVVTVMPTILPYFTYHEALSVCIPIGAADGEPEKQKPSATSLAVAPFDPSFMHGKAA